MVKQPPGQTRSEYSPADQPNTEQHRYTATFGHLTLAEFERQKSQQICALLTWWALTAAGVECSTSSEVRHDG